MAATNNSTQNRLAGIASIAIGGVTYLLAGELGYIPSTVKRETLVGQDAVHGYSELPNAGAIFGTLRDQGSLTVEDFNNMTSVNISVTLANGKTVVGSNMWCVNVQEVKTTDGTFEVRFEGQSVTEQASAPATS
jgi:hypothetical protein